jgi:hypothetical protein
VIKRIRFGHRPGRPRNDGLALFLFVESHRRRLGLSVHEFCMPAKMKVYRPQTEFDDFWTISGPTLRRRYTEFLHSARPWSREPEGVIAPSGLVAIPPHLEALVIERMAML